jgi:uncharacterized protein YcfJ
MGVVAGIIVGILIIGSVAAIVWWNISAKAAPYADEAEKNRAKREQAAREERENTVIIGAAPKTTSGDASRAGAKP